MSERPRTRPYGRDYDRAMTKEADVPTPEGCTCIHQHMDHGRGVCTIPLCPCEAGTHDGPTPEKEPCAMCGDELPSCPNPPVPSEAGERKAAHCDCAICAPSPKPGETEALGRAIAHELRQRGYLTLEWGPREQVDGDVAEIIAARLLAARALP